MSMIIFDSIWVVQRLTTPTRPNLKACGMAKTRCVSQFHHILTLLCISNRSIAASSGFDYSCDVFKRIYMKLYECFQVLLSQPDPSWGLAVWRKMGASINFQTFSSHFSPNLYFKPWIDHIYSFCILLCYVYDHIWIHSSFSKAYCTYQTQPEGLQYGKN